MARKWACLAVVFILFLVSGCLSAIKTLYPPSITDQARVVYVVSNGFHAGLVIRRDDIPTEIWPEHVELPSTEYVEVGWGSEGFYMAPRITPAIAVRALCWPSAAVLHVACFSGPPDQVFVDCRVVGVRLSESGFNELCRYIHESYELDAQGHAIALAPGLYGESEFYRARGKYYFPNTCNAWTARALRAAGCPITPAYCATAQVVILQTRRFGEKSLDR
jgi:uncharacterized protein (TIGR02117 family)